MDTLPHIRQPPLFISNLTLLDTAVIRGHTDTLRARTRSLIIPILMDTMVTITEGERHQSGIAFASSLEWILHRAHTIIPTGIRGAAATTLFLDIIIPLARAPGCLGLQAPGRIMTITEEKWTTVVGRFIAINQGCRSDR